MDFEIPPLVLRPPNLKATVERQYEIEAGLTKGEQRNYQIGFEGSALSSDQVITLTTEWLDHDNRPLPQSLPGYTGQFARVVGKYEVGRSGDLDWFSIKPGKNMQVVKLPEGQPITDHFYFWVNGEPKSRFPDFSTNNDAPGPLKHRPAHYVPLKVVLFDKATTEAKRDQRRLAIDAGFRELSPKVDPVYKDVYRPEFQFSIHGFNVNKIQQKNASNAESIINFDKDEKVDKPLFTASAEDMEIWYDIV